MNHSDKIIDFIKYNTDTTEKKLFLLLLEYLNSFSVSGVFDIRKKRKLTIKNNKNDAEQIVEILFKDFGLFIYRHKSNIYSINQIDLKKYDGSIKLRCNFPNSQNYDYFIETLSEKIREEL